MRYTPPVALPSVIELQSADYSSSQVPPKTTSTPPENLQNVESKLTAKMLLTCHLPVESKKIIALLIGAFARCLESSSSAFPRNE